MNELYLATVRSSSESQNAKIYSEVVVSCSVLLTQCERLILLMTILFYKNIIFICVSYNHSLTKTINRFFYAVLYKCKLLVSVFKYIVGILLL